MRYKIIILSILVVTGISFTSQKPVDIKTNSSKIKNDTIKIIKSDSITNIIHIDSIDYYKQEKLNQSIQQKINYIKEQSMSLDSLIQLKKSK